MNDGLLTEHYESLCNSVEVNVHNPKAHFSSIRNVLSFMGLYSRRRAGVEDFGETLAGLNSHFGKVFNTHRGYNAGFVAQNTRDHSAAGELVDWSPPTLQEVTVAIRGLKCGKAAGPNGVQAELI